MANFNLVILPLIIAIVLLFMALVFFIWLKIETKKSKNQIRGKVAASIFGYSLMTLASFSLFISLFFLFTG